MPFIPCHRSWEAMTKYVRRNCGKLCMTSWEETLATQVQLHAHVDIMKSKIGDLFSTEILIIHLHK